MRNSFSILGLLAASAYGQSVVQTQTVTILETEYGEVWMTGGWAHFYNADNTSQSLDMQFDIGGVSWPQGTMVQSWVSFEDPDDASTVLSFTCTAQYAPDAVFAGTVLVEGFQSSSTLSGPANYRYNEQPYDENTQMGWRKNDNSDDYYGSILQEVVTDSYLNASGQRVDITETVSSQSCGGQMKLQPRVTVTMTEEGSLVETNPPDLYTLKYGVSYTVRSGWKTWTGPDATASSGDAEGREFLLFLQSPTRVNAEGVTIPVGPVSRPKKWTNDWGNGGSFMSSAVLSVAALTLLAAF